MSKSQRDKGRRGEAEFSNLLRDRDWQVIRLGGGERCEDRLVTDPQGRSYSCEIKTTKDISLDRFRKQAMEQAAKRKLPWLLACHLHGSSCWLVWRSGEAPVVWSAK